MIFRVGSVKKNTLYVDDNIFHWSSFQLAVDEDFEFTELFESAHVMFFY